VIDIDCSGG